MRLKTFLCLTAVIFLWSSSDYAQAPAKAAKAPTENSAAKYFTDTELITQDGNKVRFYSDVLKDKVVVINCFFATCKGACLPMNRTLEKVQKALGDRVGKDVFLVSITVDPEMDTPGQLKAYADKLHAGAGWLFLTGTKANVDLVHTKLGQYVTDKNDHNMILIIGNERTGLWKKAYGLAATSELVPVIESVANDKGATP